MKINIQNRANLPNKNIRFIKWKLHRFNQRFKSLIYVEVNLSKEGSTYPECKALLKIGLPGHDILHTHQSHDLAELFKISFANMHHYLNKRKQKDARSLKG